MENVSKEEAQIALTKLLEDGMEDVTQGRVKSLNESMNNIRETLAKKRNAVKETDTLR